VIHIWIRQTVDWADEEAFWAQVPDKMRGPVEHWNAMFSIPFHLFRARVRAIAELNLSRVDGAAVTPWEEIPDGALVLPVDDDDWFAPHTAEILTGALAPGTDGCYWRQRWVEIPTFFGHRLHLIKRRVLPSTPPTWTCGTNSYALVKRPGIEELMRSHVAASRMVDADPSRMSFVDGSLSVANRTLSSITTLRPPNDAGHSPRRVRLRYHQYRRLYRRRLRKDIAWAQPYVDMMRELMAELQIASPQSSAHSSPNSRLQ